MKLELFEKNLEYFKKDTINILTYWFKAINTVKILQKHSIDTKIFIKEYALDFLTYHFKDINNKDFENNLEAKKFLEFLKTKNLSLSETLTIYIDLKNSLFQYLNERNLFNDKLEKEIDYIFDKNILKITNNYNNIIAIEENRNSYLLDNYIIMSQTDKKGIIKEVSEAFCKITGYEKDEIIGKNHNIIKHNDTNEEIFSQLWSTISQGKQWQGEIKNRKKDGNHFYIHLIINPIFNDNKIVGYEAIGRDITDKKELESKQNLLIEQSKSAVMGEMISMIAHQWKQPIQTVSILVQKLPVNKMIEGKLSDELLDEVVEEVKIQLEYMGKTIDAFRNFFLPNKSKDIIYISELFNKILEFVHFMMKTDSIKVNIEADDDLKIKAYENELIQVFINILKNARDVMIERKIEKREINIKYFEENKYLVIIIEDNAKGIPLNIINKIFEPYFSTKEDKDGTGLGLYMSKEIIEKYSNGTINVHNSTKGAVFTIKLPLS